MRIPAGFWLSVVSTLLLSPLSLAQSESASVPIVITHATVINPGTSSVQANQTVVITNGRITLVAGSETLQPPKNARVIDASGQYLIPGLWDMHVHSAFGDWFPGGRDIILPLFIANGVTGVRDMGGDIPVLLGWRKEIADGRIIGPRLVISGPMLDGYLPNGKLRFPSSIPVTTPASAVAAVDSLKAEGVDFIKVQSVISHDAYLAAAAEAHKQGLPIVGHVPDKVRIREVVGAGQKSIEHLMGIFEGCSKEEDKFIKGEGSLKLLLASQDEQKCGSLIKLLAQSQTWQVPTLAWQRGGTFLDQRDLKHQPLDKYVPAYWRDVTWRRFTDEMMPDLLRDPLPLRREYFARNLQIVGALHRGGVPFMAGTDTAPGVYIMPGFSLHDELANFVESGFTPMESLQTATSNPAKFLGMESSFGSVEPGKIADLVLLSANPLEDIRNTTKISAVISNGRLFDRVALDHILLNVETAAKRQN
ncbi:MAG TPA: amidohydrolase family protein [Terriglobales bacterium]|nr:amidohydrolase family protein [Terriglobales bacterium]